VITIRTENTMSAVSQRGITRAFVVCVTLACWVACTAPNASETDRASDEEPSGAQQDGASDASRDAQPSDADPGPVAPAHGGAAIDASTPDAGATDGSKDSSVASSDDASGPAVPPGDAVFTEDFEDEPSGEPWLGRDHTEVVDCGSQGKCVRVAYEPDSRGSPRVTRNVTIPPASEYTLSYRLQFEKGFQFVKGGKLPGLGPQDPTTGCADTVPDGWSSRLMWRREGRAVIYLYHQEREERCGDDVEGDGQFSVGVWHDVALHVRVNTPGEHDGFAELFLDGVSVSRREGVLFRSSAGEATEIGSLMFHTFFGGSDSSWSPSQTVFARYDDFAVAPGGPR